MEERERSESSGEVAVVSQPANGLEVTGFWIYCKGRTNRTCWVTCKCEVGGKSKTAPSFF